MPDFGRPEHEGRWPRGLFVYTLSLLLLAFTVSYLLGESLYARLSDVQRVALPFYLKSAALSLVGVKTGAYTFGTVSGVYPHAEMYQFLRASIFDGQGVLFVVRWPLVLFALLVLPGLCYTYPKDLARRRARRQGMRMKGPELIASHTNTGIAIADLQIAREKEASHILILGDIGSGKSTVIRQMLQQIARRQETAILYDPHCEYTPQFYRPERGDIILNPLDTRSPYWHPSEELRHPAEALALAASLFPDKPGENPFFTEGPRRLFAHLLSFHPSAQELAYWMCHEDEIDRRVAGTVYASLIDRQAASQRSGILASLNMIADTLLLLPCEKDTTARWSANAWAPQKTGWLFLTSTPQTRARLLPLTSLWLDLLVMRLMESGQPVTKPVWFILDELASLQKLPQLQTAITENRKSGNPLVLGLQGRAQLEERYGPHAAETMLSQPATKIILRTSEPKAAKWASDMLGEVEIERLHESRSNGAHRSHTHELRREREPLVMASELSGLPDLRGYVKMGNQVCPVQLHYLALPVIAEGMRARPMPVAPVPVLPEIPRQHPAVHAQGFVR